ncbi:hypothetical protein JCM8097_004724 [Rhodosporidiobolus ruineniae]
MAWPTLWWGSDSPSSSPSRPPSSASPNSAPTATTSALVRADSNEGGGGQTDPEVGTHDKMQTAMATWMGLLEPFKGDVLPEKARTDPRVRQRLVQPMSLFESWKYLPFVAKQSTALSKAAISHVVVGPPKPSWGIELTLFTTFLREVSSYSHLSTLERLRSVLRVSTLLPTPKDGIVTPISFKVKRRNLRGFLAEFDAQENGSREITGEWVTNKRLWRKMTREWMADRGKEAAKGELPSPNTMHAKEREKGEKDGLVCLYLHGGAYYMFSAETHRYLTISVSRYCDARVFAINYRLAPETRFPGQLHDAVSAYMRLTVDLKIPPENIIFGGDSAGGGLCIATMMYLRDNGYPLPSGCIVMSPWCDLTMSCASWETNRPYDYLPTPNSEDDHLHPVKCLLGDSIDQYLLHPYVSPLFGDYTGLPPMLIQAGDAEVLRDEITLMAHKASLAGVKVEHEIFEDCVHVFQAFLFLEASRKAFQSQRVWIKQTLPRLRQQAAHASGASSPLPPLSTDLSPRAEFDFAEVDREVVQDAHEVDGAGKAEAASLPPTPRAGRGGHELDDELTASEEEELDSGSGSGSEGLAPSLASVLTPSVASPRPRLHPALYSSASAGSSSATSLSTDSPPAASAAPSSPTKPQRRPLLRSYTSARDLSMSDIHRARSSSSSSPSTDSAPPNSSSAAGENRDSGVPGDPKPRTRHRRALTTSTSTPSSPSPSSRPSPRFSSRPLAPDEFPKRLHSRTQSHPAVDELLRSFAEAEAEAQAAAGGGADGGEGAGERKGRSRANTRVWKAVSDESEVQ